MQYILHLKKGKTHKFEAATYEEALKVAKQWGVTAADLETVGGTPTPTPTPAPAPTTPTTPSPSKELPWAGKPINLLTGEEWKEYLAYLRSQGELVKDYKDYLAFLETPEGKNFPVPKDVADYIANREQWIADYDYYARGYTEEQLREFNTWKRYASTYGTLEDWYPTNIEDWLANYEKAQSQLSEWRKEAPPEISPAEEARRREEAYAESRYAAEERYTEAPMYGETSAAWLTEQQSRLSGALKNFIEGELPSLRSEFEATQPRPTGYPTREEARGEARRREREYEAWLGERLPEEYQEYMSLRPAQRGERLYMQAPSVRTVNW
jgi:hypothetical protein